MGIIAGGILLLMAVFAIIFAVLYNGLKKRIFPAHPSVPSYPSYTAAPSAPQPVRRYSASAPRYVAPAPLSDAEKAAQILVARDREKERNLQDSIAYGVILYGLYSLFK